MTRWKSLGIFVLIAGSALALGSRAGAQTASPLKITVRPLVRSIHFQVDPTGTTVNMATATLEWRVPNGTWKKGLQFVRTCVEASQKDPRWGTILPGAVEGATYEYRMTVGGIPYTGKVTTLSAQAPNYPETIIPLTPKDDVHAVVMANLSTKSPALNRGKVFEFAAGTYRQAPFRYGTTELTIGGDSLGWVTFRPAPGAEGKVLFDGSSPQFDVVGQGKWTPVTTGGITSQMRIYKAAYTADPGHVYWDDGTGKPKRLMWVSRDQMSGGGGVFWSSGLVTQPGYAATKGTQYKDDSLLIRARDYPAEGAYCYEGGYLYVHLHKGVDPNTVRIKVPSLPQPWCIRGGVNGAASAYGVKTKGIKFQYFGLWNGIKYGSPADMYPTGGISCGGVERITYEDVSLLGFGDTAFGAIGGNDALREDIIYKNCSVRQYGMDPSTGDVVLWDHVKGSASESYGWWSVSDGVSILDSECVGSFNGIDSGSVFSSGYGDLAKYASPYWEVDNVKFVGIPDDCIEPDGFCTSYIASRCSFSYCYKGISLAPCSSGPVLVLRNTYYSSGYWGPQAYKETATKLGNDQGPTGTDSAYKLLAHNTFINAHDSFPLYPGIGCLSSSGGTQNLHILNNYLYADFLAVDWGDGSLGYPHVFDHNWYGLRHYGTAPVSNSPWVDRWALARAATPMQGEDNSMVRRYVTFRDWQQGKDVNGNNMPGYAFGVTPIVPVDGGKGKVWLHDPHSIYEARSTHGLVDPARGDFRPLDGSAAVGLGQNINTVNVNCLPGWSIYEETGMPTAGAVPGKAGTATPHYAPTLKLADGVAGILESPVNVTMTYSATGGTISYVAAEVTGPDGAAADSTVNAKTSTGAAVSFTPIMVGAYSVSATVMDDRGASTTAETTVTVSPAQLPGGSITVSVTPSKRAALPGEPIVYTIVVENPTDRVIKGVMLTQAIPAEVTLNLASAMMDGRPIGMSVAKQTLSAYLGTMEPKVRHTITVTAVVN